MGIFCSQTCQTRNGGSQRVEVKRKRQNLVTMKATTSITKYEMQMTFSLFPRSRHPFGCQAWCLAHEFSTDIARLKGGHLTTCEVILQ